MNLITLRKQLIKKLIKENEGGGYLI